jgi:hypothetical protein
MMNAELHQLVAQFANSLDLKDFDRLGDCLADTILTDYSDLRGTPPETVTREAFVEFRRVGLRERQTHHLAGNIEITATQNDAQVVASMLVFVQEPAGEMIRIHCVYFFDVVRQTSGWRITGIRQKLVIKQAPAAAG